MLKHPLWLLAALLSFVSSTDAGETRSAIAGAARPSGSIAELEWLAGAWVGEGISGPASEVYSRPMGGTIVGHFIQQRAQEVWFYELMLIRQDGDSLAYCLKHFNSDLTGWEEKNEVQCFPLVAREDGAYYFDGLTVRRDGTDRMVSAVRVETKEGAREFVIRYRRISPGEDVREKGDRRSEAETALSIRFSRTTRTLTVKCSWQLCHIRHPRRSHLRCAMRSPRMVVSDELQRTKRYGELFTRHTESIDQAPTASPSSERT